MFDILVDMTWLATVDDPFTEAASAEVFFEILLGDTTLVSRSFKADTEAGLAGGTEANTPNTLQLVAELEGFETKKTPSVLQQGQSQQRCRPSCRCLLPDGC